MNISTHDVLGIRQDAHELKHVYNPNINKTPAFFFFDHESYHWKILHCSLCSLLCKISELFIHFIYSWTYYYSPVAFHHIKAKGQISSSVQISRLMHTTFLLISSMSLVINRRWRETNKPKFNSDFTHVKLFSPGQLIYSRTYHVRHYLCLKWFYANMIFFLFISAKIVFHFIVYNKAFPQWDTSICPLFNVS